MKKLIASTLAVLALATNPVFAQKAALGPKAGASPSVGLLYSSMPAPSGCVFTSVPFFGADLKLTCDGAFAFATATKTLTVGALAANNVTATALPAAGSITVTPQGTTGATTYTYSLQACLADGTCNAAGAASTTTEGNATLSASNFNRLAWSAVAGAASYKVRRDVGGATQGVIWSGTALTVDDTGLAGDGTAKPTVDRTGTVTAQRVDALNGTLGTESRWYYNYASAANNEFGFASWLQAANAYWIGTNRTGSGTVRSMYVGPASGRWMVSASNGSLAPIDSATQDIGTTTLLPRTIRASTSYEVRTTEGAVWTQGVASELLTLSTAGTTTDTSANLLPANSIIEAVVARVTTTITAATDWKLGDATTPGRFTAANSTLTAGTTDVGLVHVDQAGAAGPRQTTAAKVRITTTGTPGAGVIRVTVFYRQFTPPAS